MIITKRRMILAMTAVLSAVFVISCAEQKYDPSSVFPFESFQAWVKKYDPSAQMKPTGIYMRFIERDPQWEQLPAPVVGTSWLSIDYTGRTMAHDIFESRDSSLIRLIGSWSIKTHFVPDYVKLAQGQQLCKGLVTALSYMRKGDSVRVYIPASEAYSSTMSVNAGYSSNSTAGTTTNYVGFPVYFDIRLLDVVADPRENELAKLRELAILLGYDLKTDSIDKGLYMRKTVKNPKGDTITRDSTAYIWHSSYFLDGKLQTTNVEKVAKEAGYYSSTATNNKETYKLKSLTPTNFEVSTGTYLVYPKVALKMRRGETAEVLSVSWWGAGMSGALTSTPQILPYQSMRYVIAVDTTRKVK